MRTLLLPIHLSMIKTSVSWHRTSTQMFNTFFSGDALSSCEHLPFTVSVVDRHSNPVIGSVTQPYSTSSQITPIPENVILTSAQRLASPSAKPPPNGSPTKATNPITGPMPPPPLKLSKRNSLQKTATSTAQTKHQFSNLPLSTPAITTDSNDQAIPPQTSTISSRKRDCSPDLPELPTVGDLPDERKRKRKRRYSPQVTAMEMRNIALWLDRNTDWSAVRVSVSLNKRGRDYRCSARNVFQKEIDRLEDEEQQRHRDVKMPRLSPIRMTYNVHEDMILRRTGG